MITTIILAAGGSSRLGRPKQLVPWDGRPLVRHAAQTALAAALGPVVVVLGAAEAECRNALAGLDVEIVVNPDWSAGMGGSLATGACTLGEVSGTIIMLCDQPLISAEFLRRLADRGAENPVVSRFPGGQGPPVFMPHRCFPRLRSLRGDEGARAILRDESHVEFLDCPEAGMDLDTPEDEARLGLRGAAEPISRDHE